MQETPEPRFEGDTTEDLLDWTFRLREALGNSNTDKRLLREWTENHNGSK